MPGQMLPAERVPVSMGHSIKTRDRSMHFHVRIQILFYNPADFVSDEK